MTATRAVENPWLLLPQEQPFVAPADCESISAFNASADDDHRMHTDILPEPFLGLPTAEVVLLNLNPGFSEEEVAYHHLDGYFREAALANLAHRDQPYPFYFLDPSVQSPGHLWWQKRLRTLIDRFTAQVLSRRVFCLEYFGYHSKSFDRTIPHVPTQDYSFELLRRAISRDATIIAMRSRDLWFAAVPELVNAKVYTLNSWQNVYITEGNCPAGYAEIVRRLSI